MERTIRFTIAYDGTGFHGWQRQLGVRTVQEELENVLQRILRHPLSTNGASRTDAGVHARGQVASVITTATIPVENLRRAIGHHLPPDMALVHAAEVPASFHPARNAAGKLYRYRMFNAQHRPVESLEGRFAWHVWYPLDLDRLRAAAAEMTGTHDFAGFASQGSPRATTVRTVRRIHIRRRYDEVLIDVEGDGFLYNQVRNMVGTLFEIGRGHWEPERVREIIATGDRRLAGPTAPAHGLCLQWVRYTPWEVPS
jgi:tRNA pseudouridine38-40 synthase